MIQYKAISSGMRFALFLCLFASPTWAWQFTTDPVCTIWKAVPSGEMVVTYDPTQALPYSITVEVAQGVWTDAPNYSIHFDGPNPFSIATNRHQLIEDGKTVSASDTGFGNVLNGLEFNFVATAILGDRAVSVGLAGAADAVQRFRDCTLIGVS